MYWGCIGGKLATVLSVGVLGIHEPQHVARQVAVRGGGGGVGGENLSGRIYRNNF